jgi:Domain of unknown function (DUF4440)
MNILHPRTTANPQNAKILHPRFPQHRDGNSPHSAQNGRHRKNATVSLFLAGFLSISAFSRAQSSMPAPVEIVNLEQNLWTTMAEGNFSTVRSLFAKDFIQVNEKIQAADAILVNLRHCRLESYELRDLQVRILSPDSALTAYRVVDTFNCGTEDNPQVRNYDNNSITVWVRQPNTKKWLVQAHTESPTTPAK